MKTGKKNVQYNTVDWSDDTITNLPADTAKPTASKLPAHRK